MKGFSDRFANFPDYILGITKEIWEGRGIGTLHAYYSDDIIVRSPGSLVIGNANVIGATMATLAEFPDRRLLGEDVIWSGTPEKRNVIITSNFVDGDPSRGWSIWQTNWKSHKISDSSRLSCNK